MSDLLNQASLVMVPSGYKEDVVYSVVPSDGSGDLSFTRASNGTRINSAGLVEVCPWNLASYSEDFANAYWDKGATTITSDATIAPNGTTTADKICDADNSLTVHLVSKNLSTVGVTQTASVYMKKGDYDFGQVHAYDYSGAIFDLVNGVVVSSDGLGATITAVGNGWYRCTYTFVALNFGVFFNSSKTSTSAYYYTGTTGYGIFAWGYQLNIGSTAKPYFPTTDRLNVPRLTYQNGGGGCPSLLLEPQRTNVAYYSNDLATAPNVVDASTTTANVYVSPDGTQNAMRFTETTANDRHGFYQYTTVTAQTYTASIFTKQTGRRYISFLSDMKGVADAAYFDLQTKTAINVSSGYTCSVEDFGNGWLRLIVTFTASAGSHYVIWGGSPDGSSTTYAGSTSISQTFYGYQLEAGSYATSLINTTSSTATRVADACFKTGISSLIGQTEGVVFWDINFVADGTEQTINISDGTNYIYLQKYSDNKIYTGVYYGSFVGSITSSVLTSGRKKIAFGYILNSLVLYINGVSIGTDLTSTIPTCDRLSLTVGNTGSIETNNFILFPTKLTNAELASLTTI